MPRTTIAEFQLFHSRSQSLRPTIKLHHSQNRIGCSHDRGNLSSDSLCYLSICRPRGGAQAIRTLGTLKGHRGDRTKRRRQELISKETFSPSSGYF